MYIYEMASVNDPKEGVVVHLRYGIDALVDRTNVPTPNLIWLFPKILDEVSQGVAILCLS